MREGESRMFPEKPEQDKQNKDFSWPPLDEFQRIRSEYVRQHLEDIKEILQNHGAQETEIPLLAELFARAFFVANYVEDHLKPEDIKSEATINFHREKNINVTAHASGDFLLGGKPIEEDDWASITEEQAESIRIENVEISFNLSSFEVMTRVVNETIKDYTMRVCQKHRLRKLKRKMIESYGAVVERIAVEETMHSIDIRKAADDVELMKQIINYHHVQPEDDFEGYKEDPLEQIADHIVRSFIAAYYPESKILETEDAIRKKIKRTTSEDAK